MNKYFIIILIQAILSLYSIKGQSKSSSKNYTNIVRDVEGDLNDDGKPDRVLVIMDIVHETTPMILEIFLSDKKGKLYLAITSEQIIEPQYPVEKKGKFNGYQIPDFLIEKGKLLMRTETAHGNVVHEFKYRNNNFDLTDLTYFTYDGRNIMVETFYNLQTGLRTEVTDIYDGKTHTEKTSKKTSIKVVNPLPKITDFKYTDKERY